MKTHIHGGSVELERVTHGSARFPCVCYDSWIREQFPAFHLHWHPEVELNLAVQGQAEAIVDFHAFPVYQGDIILINRKTVHGFFRAEDWDFNCKAVVFRLDLLASRTADDIAEGYILPLERGEQELIPLIRPDHPVYPRLRQVLEEIFSLRIREQPHCKLLMKAKLLEALYLLVSENCVRSTGSIPPRNRSLKQTIDFIGSNYTRPIPAQEAAAVAGYSKYHFLRIFKEAVGMDYTRYVNGVRLGHAARLLEETGMTVTEIALSVGFSDSAYFTKRFREVYHTTPLAFRRSRQTGQRQPEGPA